MADRSVHWPPPSRTRRRRPEDRTDKFKAVGAGKASTLLPGRSPSPAEAAWRVLSQRPFDEQVMGRAMALHFSNIAEMMTGRQDPTAAVLPACQNALAGNGVRIVTVNDYLAKRDARWMGQCIALGLDVGGDPAHQKPDERRVALPCRHHLRHQQRVRLRLPARQHGALPRGGGFSAGTATPSSTTVDSILVGPAPH